MTPVPDSIYPEHSITDTKYVEIWHTKSLAIYAGLFYNDYTIIFQSFSKLFEGRVHAGFHEKRSAAIVKKGEE